MKIKKHNEIIPEESFGLSSPWVLYCRKLQAMFGKDEEITIVPCIDDTTITLNVTNTKKAAALRLILPETCEFGNVTLTIDIQNVASVFHDVAEVYQAAFDGNRVFGGIEKVCPDGMMPKRNFIMFTSDLAQFFADNTGDPDGYETMLYQDIAKDILKGFDEDFGEMVYYCTER